MTQIAEILEALETMPDSQKAELEAEANKVIGDKVWFPSSGPQSVAYYSKAEVILYGGEPGGGKSSLLLGLAFEEHQRSLILRRQYTNLGHLLEEAQKFNGGKDGYNGSPPPKLKRPDGRVIDFGAAAKVGDEQQWQGNPHDFIGVDEATQFAESQIRFLMGWLRSVDQDQHKRVVFATNPPLSAEGLWVTEMFAPWIDEKFPNPAKPGELRWAILGSNDKEQWVDGPDPVWNEERQKYIDPKSYTFIPASLNDNPFLANTGYDKQLDGLPEEIRSIMMGGFKTVFRDDPFQTIPTAWVKAAMDRWKPDPPDGVPMCAIGVDVAQGGSDRTVLAPRHDGWFAPLIVIAGELTPDGKTVAGLVVSHRRDNARIIIDMGGGYGGAAYEHLKDNNIDVKGYKGAAGSEARTKDRQLKFYNTRSAAYWKLREALDPSQPGGSIIMLPNTPQLLADLTAPTFEVGPRGIQVETKGVPADSKSTGKKGVVARLGRSTDYGDPVVMSWFDGLKGANIQGGFKARNTNPKVVMSKRMRKR
jgi:hypothetical protein